MFETRVLSDLSKKRMNEELDKLGCDEKGTEIMTPKSVHRLVFAKGLDPRAANIVKQEFLSAGGEAAVSWEALNISEENSRIIMMGTLAQYEHVLEKLRMQPFSLENLADEIESALNDHERGTPNPLPWGEEGTQIMGVLNVTPDSFYDGGRYETKERAVERGIQMAEEGADIIDVGGESTRPGSERISSEEEMERTVPVIEELSKNVEDVHISIDSYKPEVAEAGVEAGASMINDVFGLRQEGMLEKAAELEVPVIIMHMQGEPKTMQDEPRYDDVIEEIYSFLSSRAEAAVDAGIDPANIIIDPGIGFGKKLEHNLEIIKRLDEFNSMGYPVLLGASRKSMFGDILGKEEDERLYGSLAVAALAVKKNAAVLRVHDVKETKDVIRTIEALR